MNETINYTLSFLDGLMFNWTGIDTTELFLLAPPSRNQHAGLPSQQNAGGAINHFTPFAVLLGAGKGVKWLIAPPAF